MQLVSRAQLQQTLFSFAILLAMALLFPTAAQADLLTVVNATESNNDGTGGAASGTAMATVNGDGLGTGFPATHTGANIHGWLGLNTFGAGTDYGWLHYDFGSVQTLESLRVWNYNYGPLLSRGVSVFSVYVSNDSAAFGDDAHGSWAALATGVSLNMAPGHTTNTAYGQEFFVAPTNTQYVRLEILDNWGNGVNTALAEVQFLNSVPEPTMLLPFGLMVLGLSFRRQR